MYKSARQHSLSVPALPRYFDGVASGVQSRGWIDDKRPSHQLDLNAQRALYIDNHMAIGVDPCSPLLAAQDMRARLDKPGIVSSLDEVDGDTGEYIGYSLNGAAATWRLPARKFWQLRFAADHLLRPDVSFTGHELERCVGHCVWVCCLRRCCFAIL